jgi:hypothetical protein
LWKITIKNLHKQALGLYWNDYSEIRIEPREMEQSSINFDSSNENCELRFKIVESINFSGRLVSPIELCLNNTILSEIGIGQLTFK